MMTPRVVLVVDDQEDNRRILLTLLRHEGFGVLTAESGGEAVKLAETRQPDLIMLDLMMPGADGWAAMKELQRRETTRAIPVMAVTAADEAGLKNRLRDAGFCAYLKKPFFPKEALDAVERCLAGPLGVGKWIDLPNYESLRPPTI